MYEKPTIFINTAFEKHAKKGVLFFFVHWNVGILKNDTQKLVLWTHLQLRHDWISKCLACISGY